MREFEYLTDELLLKGKLYCKQFPASISGAIYRYGDYDIKEVIGYIEWEEQGILLTRSGCYYSLTSTGHFDYSDIHTLMVNPIMNVLTVNDQTLSGDVVNMDMFSKLLSEITDIEVTLDLEDDEKIRYYVKIVLQDIIDDLYEDVTLSNEDYIKIKEFEDEMTLIDRYPKMQRVEEYDALNRHALEFFDKLELDSEEIDALEKIHINHSNRHDEALKQAMHQYDDLLKGFNDDPKKMGKIKSMASSLGIDMDEIMTQSPEQLNETINDLCDRFDISRSQLETLAKKFQK